MSFKNFLKGKLLREAAEGNPADETMKCEFCGSTIVGSASDDGWIECSSCGEMTNVNHNDENDLELGEE